MPAVTIAPVDTRYVGDDWVFPIAIVDSLGVAVNLTSFTPGAEFFKVNVSSPVLDLTLASGIVMPAPATGIFTATIPRAQTVTVVPQAATDKKYPTRLQVYLTDGAGNRTTVGIIPILPLDPRLP